MSLTLTVLDGTQSTATPFIGSLNTFFIPVNWRVFVPLSRRRFPSNLSVDLERVVPLADVVDPHALGDAAELRGAARTLSPVVEVERGHSDPSALPVAVQVVASVVAVGRRRGTVEVERRKEERQEPA